MGDVPSRAEAAHNERRGYPKLLLKSAAVESPGPFEYFIKSAMDRDLIKATLGY